MDLKIIQFGLIRRKVAELCAPAAVDLPADVEESLQNALAAEKTPLGKHFLSQCLENARLARAENIPICQDTGAAVFFVETGDRVVIEGGALSGAINQGVADGYKTAYLRKSMVADPLFARKNTGDNTPAIIHIDTVPGDTLKIILAPKGGGSENMSAIAMLKPSDGVEGLVRLAVDTVVKAGGNPCPPVIVGVGAGGNFERCAILAKKALLRKVGEPSPHAEYAALERRILDEINASGVGPQGLGGSVTALAVHIEFQACHIASLPVAVNLNCHAARHKEIIL
jgi:fumarate hydratase subunit alpha